MEFKKNMPTTWYVSILEKRLMECLEFFKKDRASWLTSQPQGVSGPSGLDSINGNDSYVF